MDPGDKPRDDGWVGRRLSGSGPKQKAYREVLRVLRPGGAYLFNAWGDLAANPFAEITYDVAGGFFTEDPPQFYKVPFSYSDTKAVEADMKTAGFHDVSRETIEIEKEVQDWARFARGTRPARIRGY